MVAPLSRMRPIPAQPMGPKTLERFFSLVHRPKDDLFACWLWLGGNSAKGHGRFRFDGKLVLPHRLSYAQFRGEVPEGLYVCHHCDVGGCVRPDHLFLGTCSDNMRDCSAKGRCNTQDEAWRERNRDLNRDDIPRVTALLSEGLSMRAASLRLGLNEQAVMLFCNRYGLEVQRFKGRGVRNHPLNFPTPPATSSPSRPTTGSVAAGPLLEVA